jgi:hypothetical protein
MHFDRNMFWRASVYWHVLNLATLPQQLGHQSQHLSHPSTNNLATHPSNVAIHPPNKFGIHLPNVATHSSNLATHPQQLIQ